MSWRCADATFVLRRGRVVLDADESFMANGALT